MNDVLVLTPCELCGKRRAVQKCILMGNETWLCEECIKAVFKKFFPDDPVSKFYEQMG